jgi:ATP-dependent RNA helicase DeaD
MQTYRVEVGRVHHVQPGNIVGAIANEAGLDGALIGHIEIREDHSFVDLPEGMPKEIFRDLKKVRVRGAQLRISRADAPPRAAERLPRGDQPVRPKGDPRDKTRGHTHHPGRRDKH